MHCQMLLRRALLRISIFPALLKNARPLSGQASARRNGSQTRDPRLKVGQRLGSGATGWNSIPTVRESNEPFNGRTHLQIQTRSTLAAHRTVLDGPSARQQYAQTRGWAVQSDVGEFSHHSQGPTLAIGSHLATD